MTMAKKEKEAKAPENPTICCKCENHEHRMDTGALCYASDSDILNYVTGQKKGVPCSEKNTDGKCPDFRDVNPPDPPEVTDYPNAT
jgi:hypothetical protein